MANSFAIDIPRFLTDSDHLYLNFCEIDEETVKDLLACFSNDFLYRVIQELNNITILDDFETYEIPVFGTLETCIIRVPELLVFASDGLTFKALGKQLLNSYDDVNTQKYGEVSAKTSELMNLVNISIGRPKTVRISHLGQLLLGYTLEEKKGLIKAILLQNRFVQSLVYHSVFTIGWKYGDWVKDLSQTSKMRRRQNVRKLLAFVLDETGLDNCIENIDWSI